MFVLTSGTFTIDVPWTVQIRIYRKKLGYVRSIKSYVNEALLRETIDAMFYTSCILCLLSRSFDQIGI